MDRQRMVINAVELAKGQGVKFQADTPTFRPANEVKKYRFHVGILTNTAIDSDGVASIDQHFDVLDNFNEKELANYFIKIFNALNIKDKAHEII